MKLLFVCGASVADGDLRCASWIKSLASGLCGEYELTLASHEFGSQTAVFHKIGGGELCLRSYRAMLADERSFSEYDVIVLFGTENAYTRETLLLCQRLGLLERTAVFAQGIAYSCALHYAEGLPHRVINRSTFRDFLRRQNIKKEQAIMQKRAEAEREALALTRSFIGRTEMDRAVLEMYSQSAAYYRCNDVLRDSFYEGEWSYEGCEKRRIFICQYYYPLKGFHYLLEAAAILKKKYPDLRIAAAGYNPITKPLPQKELKDSSYIRYIKSLISRLELSGNISLLGELGEREIREEYLKANVFVLPSTIENSPNSLAEAMTLGVPSVAADVGGVADFARHGEEAYLYPSSAAYMLAHYIDNIFSDLQGAEKIARAGRARALREYDRQRNLKTFKEIISSVSQKRD